MLARTGLDLRIADALRIWGEAKLVYLQQFADIRLDGRGQSTEVFPRALALLSCVKAIGDNTSLWRLAQKLLIESSSWVLA
jgi:hypothetical protein